MRKMEVDEAVAYLKKYHRLRYNALCDASASDEVFVLVADEYKERWESDSANDGEIEQ